MKEVTLAEKQGIKNDFLICQNITYVAEKYAVSQLRVYNILWEMGMAFKDCHVGAGRPNEYETRKIIRRKL